MYVNQKKAKMWYDKLWKNTVDLFRSMDIPVRTLECCSGDLADLKVKSVDVEAWSPRQKKYFEVGSCSNLGDAQARRLRIRIKGENGNYFAHTLNNTVVAPPRMLIAFLENNLNEDGSVAIPEVLRPYMGGLKNKEIREKSEVPIIVVTSRDSEMDELMSINLGADDFVTKPYNTQILLARISAMLKRTQKETVNDSLQYKGLKLQLNNSTVIYKDQRLSLVKTK